MTRIGIVIYEIFNSTAHCNSRGDYKNDADVMGLFIVMCVPYTTLPLAKNLTVALLLHTE
jgi:hypothetical protein